jgi:hypothetical protein
MNARTAMPLLLLVMTVGAGTVVRAQKCSCYDAYSMDSASGKEVFQTYTRGHEYKITSIRSKTTELYIDNKKVDESEFPKYADVIEGIETDMRQDARDAENDREEARRDREEERIERIAEDRERVQERAERIAEDRERVQERAERIAEDRERVEEREQERVERIAEKQEKDAERAERAIERDDEDADSDQQDDADDREMMRALVSYIVAEGIVPNTESLKSMALTDNGFVVNGVKQSQKQFVTLKEKFGDWVRKGLSYGTHQAPGTAVFFYKLSFGE